MLDLKRGRAPGARALSALMATVAVGCFSPSAAAQPTVAPKAEAPALAEQVKAGRLPPLAQRLPKSPLVIAPAERVGVYGGTWRSALRGTGDDTWIRRTAGYDSLVRWDATGSKIIPNLAESFEASPDARRFSFRLREGVKWSDGQPFTSADLMFWFEDVLKNRDVVGRVPGFMRTSGGDCGFEAPGPFEFVVSCPAPNGMFMDQIAGVNGEQFVNWPKHYLQRFHAKYAPKEELDKLVADARVQRWGELFLRRAYTWGNPDKPTLFAWRVTQPYAGQRMTLERNPFYWKIDTAGNQLPYIDRITYDIAQDNEVLLLKGLNGDFDFHARHFNTIANKSLVSQNQDRGRYEIVMLATSDINYMGITFNPTHADAAQRAITGQRDFRVALSHAINRAEIIDLVFLGAGEPWQTGPRKDGPFFHERLAKQHTEHDPARANAILDRLGYTRRNAEGVRLDANGAPIRLRVSLRNDRPEMVEALQLVQKHWASVGIALDLDVVERSLFRTRNRGNQVAIAADDVEAGKADLLMDSSAYTPHNDETYLGVAWFNWLVGQRGEAAQEPPEDVKRGYAAYLRARGTIDPAARAAAIKEMLDIAAERFEVIGIASPSDEYGVVSRRMRNVPRQQFDSFYMGTPGPMRSEQFFFAAN
jgi:peptide/nickel transport system substrate-binding protein